MSERPQNSLSNRTKHLKDRNKRPTFGFLLASLHTGASRALWPGIIDSAERLDVNIICFPGGRLRAEQAYESQRNVIYDLADEECLDGIITWASSLGGVAGLVEVNAFHSRYQKLPIVSLAEFMEGIPTVSIDSYHGMRALLEHLINDHGYKHLAFIRGPEEHYYAQERYRAYIDSLLEHNLPLDQRLVTRPLRWESGAEAVNILLDERGLKPGVDFQGVAAVSDMLALWALKTLQDRGYQIPRDVAVTGFNNSIEERMSTPPLTTVDLPFYNQGAKAVETLLSLWKGSTVPALITLPTEVVVRQSCGCPSAAVAEAGFNAEEPGQLLSVESAWEQILASRDHCLSQLATHLHLEDSRRSEWLEPIIDDFLSDITRQQTGVFLVRLSDVLDQAMHESDDIFEWHGAVSLLRRWALPGIHNTEKSRIEALFTQAHIAVSEAVQRSHAYWQWQAERQAEKLRETTRLLLTTFDIPQLIDVLTECLPRLRIPSAYVAIYEHPEISLEQARLILAYTSEHGRIPLDPGGRIFPADQLVPHDLLPPHRCSMVVEPLFFQDKPLGFAVFEFGPHEGEVYEILRSNLSSAVQGAFLFQEIQEARITAEKADQIKTRLLANVSHEMRTPLNIIISNTQNALKVPHPYPGDLPEELVKDLRHIQSNAEHQLRVINDLLDLSRAQIDELDLSLELMDPLPVLSDSFHSLADQSTNSVVVWRLELPERLPVIRADPVRLRQILLNFLSNARKFTQHGQVLLGAEVAPPELHIWVSDTGLGIPPEQKERIFEPFVTMESDQRIYGGIGLGLTITRHLIALHGGRMALDSQPGEGSTFHVYLPLPPLSDEKGQSPSAVEPVLLLVSSANQVPKEIIEISQRQGLRIHVIRNTEDLEEIIQESRPMVLAWDLAAARQDDWTLVRRLKHYSGLYRLPFILFGQTGLESAAGAAGMTGFVLKSGDNQPLLAALDSINPLQADGPIMIVDDEPAARIAHQALAENAFPGFPIRLAENGTRALEMMSNELPVLVLLDMMMPDMSGADVLDRMRADSNLRQVPVIILSNKVMTLEDVRRLENHYRVVFQTKGIWSEAEAISVLHRALFGTDILPPNTSALVKRAVSLLQERYAHPLSLWEIAESVGVSEDYLGRVFHRELGVTPWDYLNRYRILQAKTLLLNSTENIGAIARQVGFHDQAYFSRVFRKAVGRSPQAFRRQAENN